LVFHFSTIAMTHVPINIRLMKNGLYCYNVSCQ